MRRFKNLVIGGIENKIINLILFTVILLTAAFVIISARHNSMLSTLTAESNQKQQTAIEEITGTVMDAVVEQSMTRSAQLEAQIADELFQGLKARVEMLGQYTANLFSYPEAYPRMLYAAPDPAYNGLVIPQMILADGVDGEDPQLRDRLGLIANISDMMVSMFGASDETNSCFVALPEGVFLVTDDRSATKFDSSGAMVTYDPRTRPWYQLAVEKGGLIFTDVEIDAFTGDIGIVCAMPVYQNGQLAAVVGSDLFLNSMKNAVQSSRGNGNYICVINQNGHVVFSPQTEGVFQVQAAQSAVDLRETGNEALSALISDAMRETTDMRSVALEDGGYYMIGAPLKTLGWAIISVCSQEAAGQPAAMLRQSYEQIQAESVAAYREKSGQTRTYVILLLALISLGMLTWAIIQSKRIVKPLNTITERISQLSETNLEFKMEDAYRTGDEVEELAQAFANISHKTVEYLDTVKRVTAEKERIGAELSLATKIQAAMLPHIVPAFPDRKDFDIIGVMDPAKEVGGDFYDYFLIDDDHLGIVMADVSGKGVPAALFMMASKIILQSVAMLGGSPAEILTRTNQAICSSNEAQMFVTVWVGILELSTGLLTAANAGHEYPVFKQPDGSYELYKDRHGFVIGGLEGAKYREYQVQLEPGAKLFVYTDGVPEATNAAQELFGTDRMLAALNRKPDAAPMDVLKNMRQAVDDFVKDAEQFDDLTMLCLEYKGSPKKKE